MNVRNVWRRLTAWCAIGVAAVGLIDPVACTAAWTITMPALATPPTAISNVLDLEMKGTGTAGMAAYTCRLYSDPGGILEGQGVPTFTGNSWTGVANKTNGRQLYTSGTAIAQIYENTTPKAAVTVTVS